MRICADSPENSMLAYSKYTCADPESFVRGGPTLTTFFKFDEGRDDPNTIIISGQSSARQRNAI